MYSQHSLDTGGYQYLFLGTTTPQMHCLISFQPTTPKMHCFSSIQALPSYPHHPSEKRGESGWGEENAAPKEEKQLTTQFSWEWRPQLTNSQLNSIFFSFFKHRLKSAQAKPGSWIPRIVCICLLLWFYQVLFCVVIFIRRSLPHPGRSWC